MTPECVDESYANPVIDSESDISQPAEVRLVKGHFDGTNIEFRIYLPKANSWEGRFFQFTYPLDGQEPVDSVKFGATHGGYTVQTTGTAGYRHIAAAAKFSRSVAADYYGVTPDSIYGYVYGWSGGSFQTVGAIENTTRVWQGAVPIVQGLEVSTLDNFSIRALASFVLEGKKSQIVAALRPGGSGDPYAVLNDVERAVLEEATRMGIPLGAWEDFDYLATTAAFDSTSNLVGVFDPTFVEDFWTKEGYLGTEQSALGDLFRAALAEDPDSRSRLALFTYHRYNIPTREGFIGYDQYRSADGSPIYPQREATSPSAFLSSILTGGASYTGEITGKVIALESMLDSDAFPWHGDWYADQVRATLGDGTDDSYRIWYTENADHNPYNRTDVGATFRVGYMPVIFQALDDVAAWAEKGIAPPRSTNYGVTEDSQVTVPGNAAARRGVQPLVDLGTAAMTRNPDVTAGRPVEFHAKIQVPPGAGEIVSVEWDFEGDGTFEKATIPTGKSTLVVKASHVFTAPGTFYPAIRVGAQRDGDIADVLTVIQNVDRTRVVVP